MKISQKKAVEAYLAIDRLSGEFLPAGEAMALYNIKKALKNQYDFQVEQEQKVIQIHGGEVLPEGGVRFGDPETTAKAGKAFDDLNNMEVEIEAVPAVIHGENVNVSIQEIEALDGIVSFGE